MRLYSLLFSFLFLSVLFPTYSGANNTGSTSNSKIIQKKKIFNVEKFRCILKVVYQRLFEDDVKKMFKLEEKQDQFTEDDEKRLSNDTISRVNNLDTYVIKLRNFLNDAGEEIRPIHDLNDVTFIRIFNAIFIDFNNFKKEYKDQFNKCGLDGLLVNTEARCRKVYGEHCMLNNNKVSFGVSCPDQYVKYKNYFCYIKCPEPYIDQANFCQKPNHIKVSYIFLLILSLRFLPIWIIVRIKLIIKLVMNIKDYLLQFVLRIIKKF